ncbi:sulfide-quinone oxidoreductase [Schizosaccharomyces japonicus yFS275]|uniref:Sulfide:quinone oxidoreductase, mitochondrial n=1 Tax=Schizosaccharomyces japonicus (strain yFS275 / FY16936) TaxID=402676 RepID=B6K0P1_SCHJY|nr:sulfide-quinone oxidoreductase [Schizosaccharomyces japonicus yFS275]EEB07512.2 sulfide-quinone oxidoreductase [Schizosaccharomyces japonicus yFS275]
MATKCFSGKLLKQDLTCVVQKRWAHNHHKFVIVGGGSAGITIAHQIWNKFDANRNSALQDEERLKPGDIAIVDAAKYHYYQPGWTLAGAGLSSVAATRRELASLVPAKFALHPEYVSKLQPGQNAVITKSENVISYDYLVIAAGIHSAFENIKGLTNSLDDSNVPVYTIYSEKYADSVFPAIKKLKTGKAIFTQPSGVLKCAGAPQKIMWMAEDYWSHHGVRNKINLVFKTGMPTLFSVKKYSDALERQNETENRNVDLQYKQELIEVRGRERIAVFKNKDTNDTYEEKFDFLHAVPPMTPHKFIAESELADASGFVAVDSATCQSTKFPNVFSLGDASGLPTSKTLQPLLPKHLYSLITYGIMLTVENSMLSITGYSSCPLLTRYGKLILAEFLYGGKPAETFGKWTSLLDQGTPRRLFYYLKKDFFPYVYWHTAMKNGRWYGSHGFIPPRFPND